MISPVCRRILHIVMSENCLSRRHFFYGSLLAGAVPAGGFGRHPRCKAGVQVAQRETEPRRDRRRRPALQRPARLRGRRGERGGAGGRRLESRAAGLHHVWPKAHEVQGLPPDARQAGQGHRRGGDRHARPHARHLRPGLHAARQARLRREAADPHARGRRACWPRRRRSIKVATQMGNQGYSHDATRVACEIFWSGEIGEVREVHAWHGRPGWPQGMQKIPAADAGARHARLGPLAGRRGVARLHRGRRRVQGLCGQCHEPGRRSAGRRPAAAGAGAPGRSGQPQGAQRLRQGRVGGQQFGFYLPFNWRGFYDFGSGLFGDWGVHILGPANWALQLSPAEPDQRRGHQEGGHQPVHLPAEERRQVRVRRSREHAAGDGLLERQRAGRRLPAARHDAPEARKIAGTGPQAGPVGAARTRRSRLPLARRRLQRRARLQLIFVGSKGYLGTADAAKASACFRARGGRSTSCPTPTCSARPAPAPATTTPRTAATGCAPARAARRPAPTSPSPGPTPSGWCSARSPPTTKASCCGTTAKMEFTNNKDATKWIKPAFRKGWEIKL